MKTNKTIPIRILKPADIRWEEITPVINQMRRELARVYNRSSLDIYRRIIDPKTEAIHIQQWSTKMVYHPAYEVVNHSGIALGLTSRLRSAFGGQKLKDIKNGKSLPPMNTLNHLPLTWYVQTGFQFELIENGMYDELSITIPFPLWQVKEEVNKYTPWLKYDFIPKKITPVKFILSTQRLSDRDMQIIEQIIDGTIKVSTIELIKKKKKDYIHISISQDIPVPVTDQTKTGLVTFGFEHPVEFAIKGKKLKIKKNIVHIITKKQLARIREQSYQNTYDRNGHGVKHKFDIIKGLSDTYRLRRKKVVEKWVKTGVHFFMANNIGKVTLIEPDIKQKEGKSEEAILLRLHWNVKEIMGMLEAKLTENGITVAH